MISNLKKINDFFHSEDKINDFAEKYKLNFNFLNKQLTNDYRNKRILAIYDFADSPYTNDIAFFILNTEIERRRYHLEKVDIIFLTNDKYPCNPTYQVVNNHKQLINNFALEYVKLFDFIGSVSVIDNRNLLKDILKCTKKYYKIFPYDYDPKYPFERLIDLKTSSYYVSNYKEFAKKDISLHCLKIPEDKKRLAINWIKKYVQPKIPITITLRETVSIQKERNNNIQNWQLLIDSFKDDDKYIFVILRDYYNLYDKSEPLCGNNVIYCPDAVNSISFRAALYEEVVLNLGVANGVLMPLLVSSKSKYIIFKWITDSQGCVDQNFYKTYYDFDIGDQWYNSNKYQKMVWEDDTYDVLKREIDAMLKILKDDGKLYPECYSDDFKEKDDENIEIPYELYQNQKSLISQRIPLKYYVWYFKFLKFTRKLFQFGIYKSIDKVDLKNRKIVLYGAGTVSQGLLKIYTKNVVCIIDKNYKNLDDSKFENIEVLPIDSLKNIEYDYIVITPKLREYGIIEDLIEKFKIPKNKFLLGTKY